ncbi:NAD(P)-dependent oxidoreductase [Aurantibacillus circumpalustris]|uniref:NAD(P)-dependent oxidoreductase n=1 Tax=Aurantibacillus circumpalustris TaxID=3036359 RepID=UPI00295A6C1A|nr:NAD(P)-dependent oxidoreductase [Aurantibacillus circumpalustris]
MRVLFADSNHPVLHETLIAAGISCDLFWEKSTEELITLLRQYDGLVIRSRFKITKEILDTCKQLKCIGRVGAGMENIDVPYAETKNIKCLCVPEGNRDAVGEHALGMLLMLMNNLKKADAEVREGIWLRAENRGFEIKEKTVGIIGYGNMGSAFAKKLSGFECKILAYDKYKKNFGDTYVQESSLYKVFEESDILSIHLPLTEETHYIIDKSFIEKFKKKIYFINTARGKCVNTDHLVESIKIGKIKGACLDVLEYEKTSFEGMNTSEIPAAMHYLINSNKVVLSPHIAGWTHESNYKMSKGIAEKMIAVLNLKN